MRARRRPTSRSPARATARSWRCAATPIPTWAPICAPTARSARAMSRSSWPGPIASRNVKLDVSLWMTNKTPVGTYRGPGRFETDFFRERLFDIVAHDLGIDRVEFRRRNLDHAGRDALPDRAPSRRIESKDQYDSGDYQVTLDRCLEEIGWAREGEALQGTADRRPLSRPRRRLLHRGRRRRPEGERAARDQQRTARFRSIVGSSAVGQGVETVFAQIAADALEIPIDRIRGVHHGSTGYVSDGYGAYHSRSIVMGGSALLDAASKLNAAHAGAAAREAARLRRRPRSAIDDEKVTAPGRQRRWRSRDFAGLTRPKARSSTTSTPTAMARMPPMSRSIPRSAMSKIIDYVVVRGLRPHHQSADACAAR